MSAIDLFDRPSNADTGARNELDRYETPPWMTCTLLHHHPAIRRETVLEPACGNGAIARVLTAAGCVVHTNDIDRRQPADTHEDARMEQFWAVEAARPDRAAWIVANFPFNVAFEMLVHAHAHGFNIALLLRKTFLEPTGTAKKPGRGIWLQAHPPNRIIGLPRHTFRGQGNDSVSCDWMIWDRWDRGYPPIVIDYGAKERITP